MMLSQNLYATAAAIAMTVPCLALDPLSGLRNEHGVKLSVGTSLTAEPGKEGLVEVKVNPAEVYDGGYGTQGPVKLRIATGGAGQSGLVRALADSFIRSQVRNTTDHFRIAWFKSDTTYSIEFLRTDGADVAITYDPAAEHFAMDKGIVSSRHYAFRDHFLLVGPKSNPAEVNKSSRIQQMLSDIKDAGQNPDLSPPARFLSRYDKSATNMKESKLWLEIGQVPWSTAYSVWYHQYIAFPIQALTAAIKMNEYTLTDKGTLLSLDGSLRNQTIVYKAGSDEASDPLLNPAHLLVGSRPRHGEIADKFAQWLIGKEGQNVIAGFKKAGEQLYSPAP